MAERPAATPASAHLPSDTAATAAPRQSRLTIRDVARAAGVSSATVSRALRGLENVDEQTRARIVELARSMNYAVSPAASRLATGRTGTIGIVTPYVGRWYFTEVFAGVEEGLKPHDVDLLLHVTSSFDQDSPSAHIRMRRRVDGALVIGMSPDQRDLAGLAAMDVPVVLLGARADGLPSVSIDDRLGARSATEHLISSGHRRIALISGRRLPAPIPPENDRLAGYLDALRAHALPAPEDLREIGEFSIEGGERAMAALLTRSPRPTAVFCMSDEMAYGALKALRAAGVRAGADGDRGEIAVIGFDGHDLADAFDLSTVSQPVRALGRAAAELLMGVVSAPASTGRPGPEVTLPTTLVVRASSRCERS